MRVFETLQKQYMILGITSSSDQSTQKFPFNGRVLAGCSLIVCVAILQFVYIFYVANGFMEYVHSIGSASGTCILFVSFAAIAFQQTALFKTIGGFETLIDTSELIFMVMRLLMTI